MLKINELSKFKTNSHCDGGRYESATMSIERDIFETSQKEAFGICFQCNCRKSMIVKDKWIAAEWLSRFLKSSRRSSLKAVKNLKISLMKCPGRL